MILAPLLLRKHYKFLLHPLGRVNILVFLSILCNVDTVFNAICFTLINVYAIGVLCVYYKDSASECARRFYKVIVKARKKYLPAQNTQRSSNRGSPIKKKQSGVITSANVSTSGDVEMYTYTNTASNNITNKGMDSINFDDITVNDDCDRIEGKRRLSGVGLLNGCDNEKLDDARSETSERVLVEVPLDDNTDDVQRYVSKII